MLITRFFMLFLCVSAIACQPDQEWDDRTISACGPGEGQLVAPDSGVTGALLTTRIGSFAELKQLIEIDYVGGSLHAENPADRPRQVRVRHCSQGQAVVSVLSHGVNEFDFVAAKEGGFWDKVWLLIHSPYAVMNRRDLQRVHILSRRRQDLFGEGDWAFYDLAETMAKQHISEEDLPFINPKDLSEKGFINTFNHITAQAFMTAIFSESLADFIADAHERSRMPELITGAFSDSMIQDLDNGPVDNYVDMVNNEWGQELGKMLKDKYQLSADTYWTPTLLTDFLNDIQRYFSWACGIRLKPFSATHKKVIRFAYKLNWVLGLVE